LTDNVTHNSIGLYLYKLIPIVFSILLLLDYLLRGSVKDSLSLEWERFSRDRALSPSVDSKGDKGQDADGNAVLGTRLYKKGSELRAQVHKTLYYFESVGERQSWSIGYADVGSVGDDHDVITSAHDDPGPGKKGCIRIALHTLFELATFCDVVGIVGAKRKGEQAAKSELALINELEGK